MKKLLALIMWCGTLGVPLCGLAYAQNPRALVSGLASSIDTGRVDTATVTSLLVYFAVGLWSALLVNVVRMVAQALHSGGSIVAPRFTGVLAGALLILLAQRNAPSTNSASASESHSGVPVVAAVSPAVAAAMFADVLARRRATTNRSRAESDTASQQNEVLLGIEPDIAARSLTDDFIARHRVIVRVFGYPVVESVTGQAAVFRKNRALELLTWLVLNRERMRRSAARTAMWEGVVSDSSFATIVSDARRGLSEVCAGTDPREWMPPTFSDELPLSQLVVCDADLLQSALTKFRREPGAYCALVLHHLDSVRDLPFAGTNYRWPDLDGTTTRLVMLVLTAVNEVVEHSLQSDDRRVAMRALSAGLRMMPGDETLIRLQKQLCAIEPRRVDTFLNDSSRAAPSTHERASAS